MTGLSGTRDRILVAKGQKALLRHQLDARVEAKEALTRLLEARELVQALIQKVAQSTQDQLKIHIREIVQSALDLCFPGQYTFVIEFEMKRGKTECNILVDKGGKTMAPQDSNGGGLVDVIALGLRVACICLSTYDRVVYMDEPMKFVSKRLKPIMAELLKELSHKLGIQMIMVTHDAEFAAVADKTFEVTQIKGKSKVDILV